MRSLGDIGEDCASEMAALYTVDPDDEVNLGDGHQAPSGCDRRESVTSIHGMDGNGYLVIAVALCVRLVD